MAPGRLVRVFALGSDPLILMQDPIIEALIRAMQSECGLALETERPQVLHRLLYRVRSEARERNDLRFENLTFSLAPNGKEVLIKKKANGQEG